MPVQMHPETAIGELKAGDYAFPLQAVDVRGSVRGLLYSATVTQTFKNERDARMEAVYVFPLPPKAAVHGFTLTVGGRIIDGEIKERGQARREYKQAIQKGHRAAIMEEERSDIFTTTVGNIGPGEEVEIKFELSGPLSCFKNTARLRLPLVVGEVFIPGRELDGNSVGGGVTADTDEVPDASRITPPRLADGAPNPVALSVSFMVEPSGLQVAGVASTCHFARTKQYEDGRFRVSLLPGVERMDKAFVLEVTYPENMLQTSLLVDKEKKAFALTVVPPVTKERKAHPRDVVIVLDRSGSMNGWPMIAARRAAARIIDSLTPEDRFGIIAFDNSNEHFDFKQGLCHANHFYKMKSAEFLAKIDARGGTYMLPALQEGLSYFQQMENRDPHVILLTDGDVGNDSSLIRSCQTGVRISTIGIGYAAREGLLNRMAETSGGLCTLIPNESDLEAELAEMHRKWGQPVWKGLSLRGADDKFRSPKFWDVWQDVPTTFFGRLDDLGAKTEVNGWFQGRGQYSQEITPIETEDPVVYRAWARSRLLDLEDLFLVSKASPAELVSLSVSAQVLCRFTAFTAIDRAETVSVEEKMEQVMQPVEQTILKKKSGSALLKQQSLGGNNVMHQLGAAPRKSQMPSKPMLRRSRAASPPPPMESVAPMMMQSVAPPSPPPAPAPGGGGGGGDDDADLFFCEEVFDEAPAMECAMFDAEPAPEPEIAPEPAADAMPAPPAMSAPASMPAPAPKAKAEARLSQMRETFAPASSELMAIVKTLLALDPLTGNDSPDESKVRDWLSRVGTLIKQITSAMRGSNLKDAWKVVLSNFLDYQEALQDLVDGGGVAEVKRLRGEIDASLKRI